MRLRSLHQCPVIRLPTIVCLAGKTDRRLDRLVITTSHSVGLLLRLLLLLEGRLLSLAIRLGGRITLAPILVGTIARKVVASTDEARLVTEAPAGSGRSLDTFVALHCAGQVKSVFSPKCLGQT